MFECSLTTNKKANLKKSQVSFMNKSKVKNFEPLENETDLLDLLVVIAQSWKLLFFVPLLIGIATFLFINSQPSIKVYRASTVMNLSEINFLKISNPSFFRNFLAQADISENTKTGASFSITKVSSVKYQTVTPSSFFTNLIVPKPYFVSVSSNNKDAAITKNILESLISEIRLISASDPDRLLIKEKITILQGGIDRLKESIKTQKTLFEALEPTDAREFIEQSALYANNIASLNENLINNEIKLAEQETALNSFADGSVIEPIKETSTITKRDWRMPTILSILASGFILLILVFIREEFRNAKNNPEAKIKIKKIKNSFGFGKKTSS